MQKSDIVKDDHKSFFVNFIQEKQFFQFHQLNVAQIYESAQKLTRRQKHFVASYYESWEW